MIKEVSIYDLKDFNMEKTDNPFTKYIGYYINDVITGYIEYNDIYEKIDIVNIYVKEEYRNKGVGYNILSELVNLSKRNGKENITLEVNIENDIAIKLYNKCGFKKVAIREGYYNGTDGYLMELVL